MLLLKLFLVPLFVAIVAVTGRRWGAGLAGLLSGLPIIAGPILYFIYLENGLVFAQSAAAATVSGIIALSTFCFSYAWLCTRFGWKLSLLLSASVYLLTALLVGTLNMHVTTAVLLAFTVLLLQMYFSPALEDARLSAPASNYEIVCRMVFSLLLVLGITHFVNLLGATYSGIFAAFPIAGSTIALFSHRNYSAAHAIRSLKSMKQGLISMLAFFYVLALAADELGFSTSLVIAIGIAIAIQLVMFQLKKRIKVAI